MAATAGDWNGALTAQSWDTNTSAFVPSAVMAFQIDPDETVAADTAKGKLLFISNAGTGSSPVLKAMSFDAKGRLKVNGAPGDVAGANLDVVGDAIFSTQRDGLSSVSAGMVIYNTTLSKLQLRTGVAWVDLNA